MVKHYSRKNCALSCLFKMDLRKAYDTLNWDFLKHMMVALNFSTRFIKRIMTCVTSTQYSLILVGTPMEAFNASVVLDRATQCLSCSL